MKRILIFSLAYYPSFVSGAEAAIKEITDRIDPSDIEFHLITLLFDTTAPKTEKIGTVTVHRIGWGGGYLSKIFFIPLAALTARLLHQKLHFDALWSMMTYMLLPVVVARMLGVRVPHILTLQDGDPYEKVFKRWFILPITPLLDYGFRTAARVQAISQYLATWPAKRGYKGTVEVIYNGANPKDLRGDFDPTSVAEIQKKYQKKPGDIWLVNTARLVHQKAFDVVIRALTLLPEKVKLLIVGEGNEEHMLRELTKELNLESRVFFTGKVDRSQVTNYRKAADIFVGPSRSEGLGNAFLSAMASRLPVIATQEGGIAEYLFDAVRNPLDSTTGFAVDADSPEQIAAQVTYILENPEQTAVIVEAARKMVEERHDWDLIAKRMRSEIFAPVLG